MTTLTYDSAGLLPVGGGVGVDPVSVPTLSNPSGTVSYPGGANFPAAPTNSTSMPTEAGLTIGAPGVNIMNDPGTASYGVSGGGGRKPSYWAYSPENGGGFTRPVYNNTGTSGGTSGKHFTDISPSDLGSSDGLWSGGGSSMSIQSGPPGSEGSGSAGGGTNFDPSVIMPTPQGYEQSLAAQTQTLNQGYNQVRGDIRGGLNNLAANQQQARERLEQDIQSGVNAINQAGLGAEDSLQRGFNAGRQDVMSSIDPTLSAYSNINAGNLDDMNYLRDVVRGDTVQQQFQEFMKSPAYQFALDESLRAMENSASASGSLRSGALQKALSDRASDYASQQFNQWQNNRFNQAQGLASLGAQNLSAEGNLATQRGTTLANLEAQRALAESGVNQATGQQAANLYNNLATLGTANQLGFAQTSADLQTSLAEAAGQFYSSLADAQNQSIIGQNTRPIVINQ